jgi:hypothetical protein
MVCGAHPTGCRRIRASGLHRGARKSESRNPKQTPMTQSRNSKRVGRSATSSGAVFRRLRNWGLELVSDFEIRASGLPERRSEKVPCGGIEA